MRTRAEKIINILRVAAWIALVGYAIKGGGQLIAFILNFIRPELAKNIYGVNEQFFNLQQYNNSYFIWALLAAIVSSILKVYIAVLVIKLLSKLNVETPFSIELARKIEDLSLNLTGLWFINFVATFYFRKISRETGLALGQNDPIMEYIFIACIAYLIAQIIRRGINLQEENQLTV